MMMVMMMMMMLYVVHHVLLADCVTTGNGLKKWRPLLPVISEITTAIRSRTLTST